MLWVAFDPDQADLAVGALAGVLDAGTSDPVPSPVGRELLATMAVLLLGAGVGVADSPGDTGDVANPADVAPVAPEAVAAAIPDTRRRTQLAELAILLPFANPKIDRGQLDAVDALCRALGVHPAEQQRLHAVASHHLLRAKAHLFRRLGARYLGHQGLGADLAWLREAEAEYAGDPEIAARWQALGELPEGTLGWSFFHFYRNRGFPLPGEHGAVPAALGLHVHDASHLLAGYDTDPTGEINVVGFQAGYMTTDAWLFCGIALLDFQAGVAYDFSSRSKTFHARSGYLDPKAFVTAIARGLAVGVDLYDESQWEFWANVARPLDEIRADLNLSGGDDVVAPQHRDIADARAGTHEE